MSVLLLKSIVLSLRKKHTNPKKIRPLDGTKESETASLKLEKVFSLAEIELLLVIVIVSAFVFYVKTNEPNWRIRL